MCQRGGEVVDEDGVDLVEGWCGGRQEFVHTGNLAAGEAAGDDEVEVLEVDGDVEGQAVGGDPPAYANAQGGDLGGGLIGAWYPDACGTLFALGGDVEVFECVDDGLLEQAHVVVQSEVEGVKVDDGVEDDLARAVVGDVPAAVGGLNVDAEVGEGFARGEQV